MIANNSVVTNSATLKERVKRVLFSHAYAAGPVSALLETVTQVGPVAIFGGLLRDLCFFPPSPTPSDIDMVVATDSSTHLENSLSRLTPNLNLNRYGGHRIALQGWTFDVWALDQTWAFKNRLLAGRTFGDLVKTTFFNWDAIVFEVAAETFHYLPNYFQCLDERILEINLEPNANPPGNAARALRFLKSRQACWGPKLTSYMYKFLSHVLEQQSPSIPSKYETYLTGSEARSVFRALDKHFSAHARGTFAYSSTETTP